MQKFQSCNVYFISNMEILVKNGGCIVISYLIGHFFCSGECGCFFVAVRWYFTVSMSLKPSNTVTVDASNVTRTREFENSSVQRENNLVEMLNFM